MHRLIGYFDGPAEKPTYNPGLDVPCIVCNRPLSAPIVTNSLALQDGSRSYFYRMHKACRESLTEADEDRLDGSIIDRAAIEEREASVNPRRVNRQDPPVTSPAPAEEKGKT